VTVTRIALSPGYADTANFVPVVITWLRLATSRNGNGIAVVVGATSKLAAPSTRIVRIFFGNPSGTKIFVSGPIFFVLVGGACVLGWKMTAERHAEVRAELDRLDALVGVGAPDLEPPPGLAATSR